MRLIQTITVGAGGASSIDFTSIPQTYTDLLVVLNARSTESSDRTNLYLRVNSVTSAYTYKSFYGSGSSPFSSNGSGVTEIYVGTINGATSTSNTFGTCQIYIPNYTGSTYKLFGMEAANENNATQAFQFIAGGQWANTAAITSVNILPSGGTPLVQYSTASLYGITKGSGGATVA